MFEIPGFSRYTINDFGAVVNKATGLIEQYHDGRYKWVYIYSDDKQKKVHVDVHVLLALATLGPRPAGCVASLVDGNPDNLNADNVKWVERRVLAASNVTERVPKQSTTNTPDSRRLVYETMVELGEPVTMVTLANMLQVPYSVIRYSMYHLLADGNAKAVKGGYVAI